MAESAGEMAHEAAEHTQTQGEYIQHHLQFLTFGKDAEGHWGFAHGEEAVAEMGYWSFHVDMLGWSIGLGLILYCYSEVPLKMQHLVCRVVFKTLLNGFLNL